MSRQLKERSDSELCISLSEAALIISKEKQRRGLARLFLDGKISEEQKQTLEILHEELKQYYIVF
jgi:hypothetical protein